MFFFLIPYIILRSAQSKIEGLNSIAGVIKGTADGLILGAVICTGAMIFLTIIISRFM